ncbi:amidohydrolase [Paenibacillus sinopodophylli]|uniref:amidohydrolase n=1 Tax=Paenibacillus sinopodophylli TaxID=1837342 RepID=UPI00110D211E|nr:amidohydrolase [Paenibacillus sinopodophylli]
MSDKQFAFEQLPDWVADQVIAWRRYLHQNPELSFQEHETAAFVEHTLREWKGLTISRPTPTSVVAILKGDQPGPVVAFRADMDALPIHEENVFEFASKSPGVMHACGHDGHTAMLLATARLLSEKRESLHGEIRFIFQHAEELPPGGAIELVKAGVLDGVDFVFGVHLASLLPVGQIGIRHGEMMASPDNFTIVIKGYGGHAGFPHKAVDVIAIGSQLVGHLQHIVSRLTDPLERLVVSVTQFTAGSSHNVIPDSATLKGTVRSFKSSVRKEVPDIIRKMSEGIAAVYGASVEVDFVYGYEPVINDEWLTNLVKEAAVELVGSDLVIATPPSMGGEDFSAYQQRVPGTFVNIGAGNEAEGIVFPHHHPKFTIDESSLVNGINLFLRVADKLLYK